MPGSIAVAAVAQASFGKASSGEVQPTAPLRHAGCALAARKLWVWPVGAGFAFCVGGVL